MKAKGSIEKIVVGNAGRPGGIYMMWTNDFNVDVADFNKNTMAVKINDDVCQWVQIEFSRPPCLTKKRKAYENLGALLQDIEEPWVCLEDFNLVIDDQKKKKKDGGRRDGTSAPNFLKELMFDLGAIDLGFNGNSFTWINKRWGKSCIRQRLEQPHQSMQNSCLFCKKKHIFLFYTLTFTKHPHQFIYSIIYFI